MEEETREDLKADKGKRPLQPVDPYDRLVATIFFILPFFLIMVYLLQYVPQVERLPIYLYLFIMWVGIPILKSIWKVKASDKNIAIVILRKVIASLFLILVTVFTVVFTFYIIIPNILPKHRQDILETVVNIFVAGSFGIILGWIWDRIWDDIIDEHYEWRTKE